MNSNRGIATTRRPSVSAYDLRAFPDDLSAPGAREAPARDHPTTHPVDGRQVRNWLRVSWSRSREANVDMDRPNAAYVEKLPADTVLARAARPVLAEMAAEIESEPVSLILTDATGTVLQRYTGDRELRPRSTASISHRVSGTPNRKWAPTVSVPLSRWAHRC